MGARDVCSESQWKDHEMRSQLRHNTSYLVQFRTVLGRVCCLPEYQFLKTHLSEVETLDSPSFENSILQFKSLLHKSFLAALNVA